MSRTELEPKREYCKKTLFKQGFQAYRRRDLNRSIALWEDYLVFDRENVDIREALRTARLQQKNLLEADSPVRAVTRTAEACFRRELGTQANSRRPCRPRRVMPCDKRRRIRARPE